MVYKRLHRNKKDDFELQSDDSLYAPYDMKVSEITEAWYGNTTATLEGVYLRRTLKIYSLWMRSSEN